MPLGTEHNVSRSPGRRLEIPEVALVHDDGSDIGPIGEIIKAKVLAQLPTSALLIESRMPVGLPVAGRECRVAVIGVDPGAPQLLERGRETQWSVSPGQPGIERVAGN